jgi:predicted aspartyl protease
VSATVDESGNLKLSSDSKYRFVVDTGFAVDVAVPYAMLPRLNLNFLGYDKFVLATNKPIVLPVFEGWVKIKRQRVKVEIIPGDELLGMRFLEKAGSQLIVNFDEAEVKLFG